MTQMNDWPLWALTNLAVASWSLLGITVYLKGLQQ